jgi:hypothetical protein
MNHICSIRRFAAALAGLAAALAGLAAALMAFEVPRTFRTVHPLGWAIWKGEILAPTEEELLTRI